MEYVAVRSRAVSHIGYDAERATLGVIFKSGTQREKEYHYFNVPPEIWQGIFVAPSIGRYVNQVVKTYPYAEIRLSFLRKSLQPAGRRGSVRASQRRASDGRRGGL